MARTYGKKAQKSVKQSMSKFKRGALKSGGSGKTVKNPRQAIAIGLSEARKKGAKVPSTPRKSAKKTAPKKAVKQAKKGAGRKKMMRSATKKRK